MPTNSRTVLIIDDTPEDRALCRRYLAKDPDYSYEFLEADAGTEALAQVQARQPDCILLDYVLLDTDGMTLLTALQPALPTLPIIMLTGAGDISLAVEAIKLGAKDYLIKGRFTATDLQRAVHLAMEKAALIRAHQQAEQELAEALQKESAARAEAEAANRAKDEFLALVSHELRSPLNSIVGWARLLRNHADPQVRKVVDIVERNTKAQQQLIEDLLDSARMLAGKLRLDARPLDLLPVVRAAVEVIRPAAEAKRITLLTKYELNQEQVTGDADRLQQIVWNLLSNAVKFTPEGGVVLVRLERCAPHLCLSVSDTGRGIRPELLPHIFERFWQDAQAGSATRLGGLGLGLSLVKQLTELHGGTVSASSEGEGFGATFTVCLPLRAVRGEVQAETPLRHALQSTPHSVSLAGAHVLVVDDDTDARSVITRTLEQCGAEIRAVASGQEAIETLTLSEWHPELLICDIGMPEEDGYTLMRRVRKLPPSQGGKLPAIALTAFNQREDRMEALQAGYQIHLAKPVEPLELALAVASFIGRPDPSGA
ncbi:MAG TPA: response regulator [Blastocatellia bacterium]|nr:response regulator [Blastocatellia bacterium]